MAEKHLDHIKIIKKAEDVNKDVVGVEWIVTGKPDVFKEAGPIVLAAGGYAVDFTEQSLLKRHSTEPWNLLSRTQTSSNQLSSSNYFQPSLHYQ
ncbi:hypothetical protein BC938DRAFT_472670 [Jimgerdemannia flammicorona]|nr:hypothetical protein BC938DRAFT_472670 [Jimgerdemannia flammicorona]